jgi:amidophosphoribosyltransferase
MELVARQAIIELEGKEPESYQAYCDPASEKYNCMLNCIKKRLNFSTLKFQNIHDMIDANRNRRGKYMYYCWNGKE